MNRFISNEIIVQQAVKIGYRNQKGRILKPHSQAEKGLRRGQTTAMQLGTISSQESRFLIV